MEHVLRIAISVGFGLIHILSTRGGQIAMTSA